PLERGKTQVPGVASQLVRHDDLFMLSDDVAFRVAFDHYALHWVAGFRIDYRNSFLGRSGFAATTNTGCFDRSHCAVSCASFGYEVHDVTYFAGLIRR